MDQVKRAGLRFRRSQARVLKNIAEHLAANGIGREYTSLFRQAAIATANGEALEVVCDDYSEAELMADGFVQYGIVRPAVEYLS